MADLKSRLAAAGLTERGIAEALGPYRTPKRWHSISSSPTSSRPGEPVRLFVLGDDVPAGHFLSPSPTRGRPAWSSATATLSAASATRTVRRVVVAHDGEERIRESDYVGGVNNATRTLSTLTIREPVARVLDLGTGCGAQALLLSQHATNVVASDVNRRALDIAGSTPVSTASSSTFGEGSWFEPVGDELFDLIVSDLRS